MSQAWSGAELSEREKEILCLVATGASNKEIAARLGIRENTVKVHLRNVYGKLEVRSRTEASMAAIRMGLVNTGTAALGSLPVEGQPAPREREAAGDGELEDAAISVPMALPVAPWQKLGLLASAALVAIVALWPWQAPKETVASSVSPLHDVAGQNPGPGLGQEVGRWQVMAQMPSAKARFAAAMSGQWLIVAGGDTEQGTTASTEIYDTTANMWHSGAAKPQAVSNVSAVAIDGKVFVPGGLVADGRLTDALEIYDVAKDAWREGPRLPVALCAYALASDGQRIYLAGGWDGRSYSDRVFVLDSSGEAWEPLQKLPSPRGHSAAVVNGGRLYIIGGFNGKEVLNRVDVLELGAADKWEPGPALIAARAGLGAVEIGGSIYVLGGGWSAPVAFGERLPAGAAAWQRLESPLEGAWRNLGLVSDQSALFAVGGWKDGLVQDLYRYQAVYRINVPLVQ